VKRLPVLVTALALVALIVGFVVYEAASSGAPAFSAHGHSVSQSDVDGELHDLASNAAFARLIRQSGAQPLAAVPGSIASGYASGWVTLRVAQVFVDDQVARSHVQMNAADRRDAVVLAVQLLGSETVLRTLPASFRTTLLNRFARVAALRRSLLERPSASLRDAVLAACPSRRFVAHILVSSAAEAAAIKAQLAAGADFATLAAQQSLDTGSAARGGELGCIDGQSFVPGFQEVAQSQPVGQVSDPVQTQFGFHLILVRDQPQPAELEGAALNQVLALARGAHVTVDPRYGTWDRANGRVVAPTTRSAPAG
jgi:hypothetical protein